MLICVVVAASGATESHLAEEQAMMRMLTLNHRALLSDRPLPVQPIDEDASSCAAMAANAADADGYPVGTSAWFADFAAVEQADATLRGAHAADIEQRFTRTVHALRDSQFAMAREALHGACLSAQQLAQSSKQQLLQQRIGAIDVFEALERPAAGSVSTIDEKSAQVFDGWVHECATMLQYMPTAPPNREDHKRLFMLLHDLGSTLLLTHLLGVLPAPVLRAEIMAELAQLVLEFGEANRKTALSRALGTALGTARGAAVGVQLLREHGHCEPPESSGADERAGPAG
jgi:hypothetical protein